MMNANPHLVFFLYIAIVVGLCPVFEMMANRFSR